MRIRKRTPARAADPGPAPALSASPPRPLPLQLQHHPREESREDEGEEEEEKRVILIAGVRVQGAEPEDDRVSPAAAASNLFSSCAKDDDVTKPEPEPREGAAARCTRNDGKRWRCKGAAVPGYLFCDRHIAWSTRKRKPRPRKHNKQRNAGVGSLGPHAAKDEAAASAEEDDTPLPEHDGGGFRKRAKGGATGTAA